MRCSLGKEKKAEGIMGGNQNLGLPELGLPCGLGFHLHLSLSLHHSTGVTGRAPGKCKLCVCVYTHYMHVYTDTHKHTVT